MDFLDPKKRRKHRIQLFIGYWLMGIALIIATIILAYITFGYSVDRKTGTVIQNGLVFVDAHPESASIFLNDKNVGNTDTRLTVPAGQYTLKLQRKGYRTWQRGFTLDGGGVERFSYPFLFPSKLVTKDIDTFTSAPLLATASPDRHWIMAQQGASLSSFDQIDLSTTTNTVNNLDFPSDLFTAAAGPHKMELVEWSTDNRHLLVKHTYNDGAASEFVMMDREQPILSQNLTKAFPNVTMGTIKLRNKRFDQLYILDSAGGTLSILDTKTKQLTPAASHVFDFKPTGADQILYVTSEGATVENQNLVKLKDGDSTYTLRTVPTGTTYLLEMAGYSGNTYVVVGASSEGKVYEYKNPVDSFKKTPVVTPVPVAFFKLDNPQYVSFSQNTQYVSVQAGSKFAIYDAENDRQYRYDTKLTLDDPAKAYWMDGNRLSVLSGGKAVIFDYDGTNVQTLMTANAGYNVAFDRDYTEMFTVAPSLGNKEKIAVTRTDLKIKKN